MFDPNESNGSSPKPKFGIDQAIVYAGSGSEKESKLETKLKGWANHPFIFSALDAKGLEFSDILICFRKDRKDWNIEPGKHACLRLLRELYVAITRSRRRVVILVDQEVPGMKYFFAENLQGIHLEWTDSKVILLEFNNETTSQQWFTEGKKYFSEEKYSLAEVSYLSECTTS